MESGGGGEMERKMRGRRYGRMRWGRREKGVWLVNEIWRLIRG